MTLVACGCSCEFKSVCSFEFVCQSQNSPKNKNSCCSCGLGSTLFFEALLCEPSCTFVAHIRNEWQYGRWDESARYRSAPTSSAHYGTFTHMPTDQMTLSMSDIYRIPLSGATRSRKSKRTPTSRRNSCMCFADSLKPHLMVSDRPRQISSETIRLQANHKKSLCYVSYVLRYVVCIVYIVAACLRLMAIDLHVEDLDSIRVTAWRFLIGTSNSVTTKRMFNLICLDRF